MTKPTPIAAKPAAPARFKATPPADPVDVFEQEACRGRTCEFWCGEHGTIVALLLEIGRYAYTVENQRGRFEVRKDKVITVRPVQP
jgi:hypothetical protein